MVKRGKQSLKTEKRYERNMWSCEQLDLPSRQVVEKKLIFFVSRGLSWVNSEERGWGSDSPVRDELST